MFDNSDNILKQILPIVFSGSSSVIVASIFVIRTKKPRWVVSGITYFILSTILLIIISTIKVSKAIVDVDWLNYFCNTVISNKNALIYLSINSVVLILLSILGKFVEKDEGKAAKSAIAIAAILLLASGVVWSQIPNDVHPVLPDKILAKSFNTIPIDLLLEDERDYFDNSLFDIPQPIYPTSFEKPSDPTSSSDIVISPPEVPKTDSESIAPTPPVIPVTFSEYMVAYLNNTNNVDYLNEA